MFFVSDLFCQWGRKKRNIQYKLYPMQFASEVNLSLYLFNVYIFF